MAPVGCVVKRPHKALAKAGGDREDPGFWDHVLSMDDACVVGTRLAA